VLFDDAMAMGTAPAERWKGYEDGVQYAGRKPKWGVTIPYIEEEEEKDEAVLLGGASGGGLFCQMAN